MANEALCCAAVEWDENGEPVSTQFSDVYFAQVHGLDESRYVFVDQNNLQQRFTALAEYEQFIIGETGFGTGLNFLATLQVWRQYAPPTARLFFITAELYPLKYADLARALALWPELRDYAEELLSVYPPVFSDTPNTGYFRLDFVGNVHLMLMFADATEAFDQWLPQHLGVTLMPEQHNLAMGGQAWAVDAWFLDGFAPAKNPAMWQPSLFQALANVSKPGTTLATFTAAAIAKQGLQQAGFAWQKQRGFGRKRDMLTAVCLPFSRYFPAKLKRRNGFFTNWHITPVPTPQAKRVLVIGAGMAGCHTAFALAERGYSVTLADANALASGASGNAQGIVYSTLSHSAGPFADFNLSALIFACNFYRQHKFFAQSGGQSGLLDLFTDPSELTRIARRYAGNDHWAMAVTAEGASARAGVPVHMPALYFERAGWLNPQKLCRQLITHKNIILKEFTPVTELTYSQQQWHCALGDFDQVIIAAAQNCLEFPTAQAIKIKAIRGQVTAVRQTSALRCVVCGDGYIAPAQDGVMYTGASFNPKSDSLEVLATDQALNLDNAARLSPVFTGLDVLGDRTGLRCVTPDYLPIVGPLPEPDFLQQFADYGNDRRAYIDCAAAVYPQMFIITGLGSRGLTYSPLAAHIIASLIVGEPLPISTELWKFIHPARFWVRHLIRGTAISNR